jgi:hypothetical protein
MRHALFFSFSVLALAGIGIVPLYHVLTAGAPEGAVVQPAAPATHHTVRNHRIVHGHPKVASVVDAAPSQPQVQRPDGDGRWTVVSAVDARASQPQRQRAGGDGGWKAVSAFDVGASQLPGKDLDHDGRWKVLSLVAAGGWQLQGRRLDRERHRAGHVAHITWRHHRVAHRTHRGGVVVARAGNHHSRLARHAISVRSASGAQRRLAHARVATSRDHWSAYALYDLGPFAHPSVIRQMSSHAVWAHGRLRQAHSSASLDARLRDQTSSSSSSPVAYSAQIGDMAAIKANAPAKSRMSAVVLDAGSLRLASEASAHGSGMGYDGVGHGSPGAGNAFLDHGPGLRQVR